MGKGVSKAVENINKVIAPAVTVSPCCKSMQIALGCIGKARVWQTGIEPSQPEGG